MPHPTADLPVGGCLSGRQDQQRVTKGPEEPIGRPYCGNTDPGLLTHALVPVPLCRNFLYRIMASLTLEFVF